MKALSRITALIIVAFAFVSSNAQDFEGVWYPSKDNNIGNIKIQKKDDGYSVRIKMDDDGIKTCKGSVDKGVLYFNYSDGVEYGKYWLGYWGNEKNHIIALENDGSTSGNGTVDEIYDRSYNNRNKCATVKHSYWMFKLVPNDDDMVLYVTWQDCYCIKVYGYGERVVFTQGGSQYWSKANTYTNW